ncbi:hypothetical protein J6E39_00330 [bacterium]|nr:hypothetical protein [bacterium]
MKKVLCSLFLMASFVLNANAATTTTTKTNTYVPSDRVETVGKQIISKNNLPTVTFKVTETAASNADIATTNVLYINKQDLNYTGNDNEVAAVIAQEFGAVINSSATKNKAFANLTTAIAGNVTSENLQNAAALANTLSKTSMSTKQQMNADVTGCDLMIAAGYNPLAMIVVLGKMDGSVMEAISGTPANIKRTMNIYDYLSYNYPSKVTAGYGCKEYKNFVAYIEPTIKERNSNSKKLAKFKKEQAKLKLQRSKDLAKYKATGGTTGWDASYTILQNLMNSSETK